MLLLRCDLLLGWSGQGLGGDAWLGRTVKQLLGDALQEQERRPAPAVQAALFATLAPVSDNTRDFFGTVKKAVPLVSDTRPAPVPMPDTGKGKAAFMTPADKAALMREVDSLLSQGLSSHAIARKFNEEGRRTVRGSLFYGPKLLRELRKWKGEQ